MHLVNSGSIFTENGNFAPVRNCADGRASVLRGHPNSRCNPTVLSYRMNIKCGVKNTTVHAESIYPVTGNFAHGRNRGDRARWAVPTRRPTGRQKLFSEIQRNWGRSISPVRFLAILKFILKMRVIACRCGVDISLLDVIATIGGFQHKQPAEFGR